MEKMQLGKKIEPCPDRPASRTFYLFYSQFILNCNWQTQTKMRHTTLRGYGVLLTITTLSASRAAAFVSSSNRGLMLKRSLVCRPHLRMSFRDDEVRRLREENEELRRKLENVNSADSFSLSKLANDVTGAMSNALKPFSALMQPKKKETSSSEALVDQMLKDAPFPLRAFGGLLKGVMGMASEAMKGAASDIERIRAEVRRIVTMDNNVVSELGTDIELDSPFSQSFSSASINGRTTKRVSLQMPIRGKYGSVSFFSTIRFVSRIYCVTVTGSCRG